MKAALKNTTKVGRTAVLCLGLAAVSLSLAGVADTAEAKKKKDGKNAGQVVFASDRTTGKGVDNPEGDLEIFVMNLDGKKLQQLTKNTVDDFDATLSPDGQKIAFVSQNFQSSNREGDDEVYLMNADGSKQRNLTKTGSGVSDIQPDFAKART